MPDLRNASFKPTPTWYEDADTYWKAVPSSIGGMLGGLDQVHTPDIRDSRAFLTKLQSNPTLNLSTKYACDCGAGIGRVTKNLLLPLFDRVDLVEQNPDFLNEARSTYLNQEIQRVPDMFATGLQLFTPPPGRYDVIWCQWVLSHLTDADMLAFLRRCRQGLTAGGIVCVKENVAMEGYVVDSDDSSVTRSPVIFERIFSNAGFKVVDKQTQTDFPHGLFEVCMWAIVPI
ncbi:N-terminal Xaa-Pro-Lys N-methyltransferase 1 [Coemansia aciculifera]|nr:N-terminal Xaa-Pro-Lys N-methyltransferase 1 [Coemansia aciculifera]